MKTNEQLKATREELESAHEELKAINQELEASKAELQAKVDELTHANADLATLLSITPIAGLVLDKQLRVESYSPQAGRLLSLIPGDLGRPITDLASELIYPEFSPDAKHSMETLRPMERVIQTRRRIGFLVGIQPLVTEEKRGERRAKGVAVSFTNTTALRSGESSTQSLQRPRTAFGKIAGRPLPKRRRALPERN